jgi:hypothetical protein
MSRSIRAEAVLAVAVAAAGMAMAACALDPPADPVASDTPSVTQEVVVGSQCPPFGCGANSPVIDTQFEFHDFNLVGTSATAPGTIPNDAGLSLLAAGEAHRAQIFQGRAYDLYVVDARIVGNCVSLGCTPLQGSALVGAQIPVIANGAVHYVITIGSVRTLSYFLGGGTVESYTLIWKDLVTGAQSNLCSNIKLLEQLLQQQAGDEPFAAQELMGMRTFETVVFEGDKIETASKRMSPLADDTWFNIGCAGHTLSKLLLTHNTVHSQAAGLTGAWERRQSTMRMLVADYCGSGIPLTVPGQRLVWIGDLMVDYYETPLKFEARWLPDRAKCLADPRMLAPTSSLGATTFPDIRLSIAQSCKSIGRKPPLPCTNFDFYDYDRAYRISANP